MKGFTCVVAVIAMLAFFQLMVEQGQAITCPQVDVYLGSCVPYLTGEKSEPEDSCCNGVKSLVGVAKTSADKRDACRCVKDAANHFSNLNEAAAQALPTKCGVALDIPISKTVNCDNLS